MSDRSSAVVVNLVDYPPRLDGPAGTTLAATLSDVATEFVHAAAQGCDAIHYDAYSTEDMERLAEVMLTIASAENPSAAIYRHRLVGVAATVIAAIQRLDRLHQPQAAGSVLADGETPNA